MAREMRESDWKIFREIRTIALERFCQRVLDEVDKITSQSDKSSHERYLSIFNLLKHRDEELADSFNNPRRSVAIVQLARMQFYKLLDEEEFFRFSSEARESVQGLIELWESQPLYGSRLSRIKLPHRSEN
jgi:hypothetical protein